MVKLKFKELLKFSLKTGHSGSTLIQKTRSFWLAFFLFLIFWLPFLILRLSFFFNLLESGLVQFLGGSTSSLFVCSVFYICNMWSEIACVKVMFILSICPGIYQKALTIFLILCVVLDIDK